MSIADSAGSLLVAGPVGMGGIVGLVCFGPKGEIEGRAGFAALVEFADGFVAQA
jgi:hypothetical protein